MILSLDMKFKYLTWPFPCWADVFEYELNNPMALYGSIPYMLAHNEHDGTVGVYLNNAAEMWIDISNSVTDKGVMSKVSALYFMAKGAVSWFWSHVLNEWWH